MRRASYSVAQPAPTGPISVVPARAASARSEQVTPLARRRWHRALTTLSVKDSSHETDQQDSSNSPVDTSTHTSARKTVADMTSKIKFLSNTINLNSEFVKQRWTWAAKKLKVKKKSTMNQETGMTRQTYAHSAENTSQLSLTLAETQSIQRSAGKYNGYFLSLKNY